jgi:serine/threonine protein kinase
MERNLQIPGYGFKPKEALEKLKLFLESYEALYKRGMVHRDLKPENILVG